MGGLVGEKMRLTVLQPVASVVGADRPGGGGQSHGREGGDAGQSRRAIRTSAGLTSEAAWRQWKRRTRSPNGRSRPAAAPWRERRACWRSEEHTSELQSRQYLVCRLLLE